MSAAAMPVGASVSRSSIGALGGRSARTSRGGCPPSSPNGLRVALAKTSQAVRQLDTFLAWRAVPARAELLLTKWRDSADHSRIALAGIGTRLKLEIVVGPRPLGGGACVTPRSGSVAFHGWRGTEDGLSVDALWIGGRLDWREA